MSIAIKMPALSPTMEEGTLAKWLVQVGDTVSSGDILAEIETDKATMEFEAVDEGVVLDIAVPEGTEGVKVGTVIATIGEEGEEPEEAPEPALSSNTEAPRQEAQAKAAAPTPAEAPKPAAKPAAVAGDRILASPLARRIAAEKGIDLASLTGSGPNGRIVRADLEGAAPAAARPPAEAPAPAAAPAEVPDYGIPFEAEKLNNVRKIIARRLTEAKQSIPHIYLTVDIRLDALLKLRGEINAALEGDGVKLSVNDLLVKALAKALVRVPQCNVSFAGDELRRYSRVDISVAVAAPSGLITPIIVDAASKPLSAIATETKDLAGRAREGKLKPHEYQGGTASISNLGMYGIKQFDAVINPPQAMIMAVGAGEQRPYVVDGALSVATVMTATGSFDHRAIDGADGAELMKAFKELVEKPLGMLV